MATKQESKTVAVLDDVIENGVKQRLAQTSTPIDHKVMHTISPRERNRVDTYLEQSRNDNFPNLSCKIIDDRNFKLHLNIRPYLVESKGLYYHFETAQLQAQGKVLCNGSSKVSIGNFKVSNALYLHPFVYPSGDLDYTYLDQYGQDLFTIRKSRHYPTGYNMLNTEHKEVLVELISGITNIAQRTMELINIGNEGRDYQPALLMSRSLHPVATSPSAAMEYAKSHNIAHRIF